MPEATLGPFPASSPTSLCSHQSSRAKRRPPERKGFRFVASSGWRSLAPGNATCEQAQEVIRASFLHPEGAIALPLAQAFVKMVRERNVNALPAWLAEVQASSIRAFHQAGERRLERDRAALETALSRKVKQWSGRGPCQSRNPLIKRMMDGRAHFPLLRQRVLHCA